MEMQNYQLEFILYDKNDKKFYKITKFGKEEINLNFDEKDSIVGTIRAGVIPFNREKGILMSMIKYEDGSIRYGDFGGGCKKKESLFECMIREVKEEGGHEFVTNMIESGKIRESLILRKLTKFGKYSYIFIIQIPSDMDKKFVKNNEIEGVAWIKPYELGKKKDKIHIPIKEFTKYIHFNQEILEKFDRKREEQYQSFKSRFSKYGSGRFESLLKYGE